MSAPLKKISIVVEETGTHGGKGFQVYLSGHDRDLDKVPDAEKTTAEWWAYRLFSIVIHALKEAGVIQTQRPMPDPSKVN